MSVTANSRERTADGQKISRFWIAVYSISLALFGLLAYLAHQLPYFPGDIAIAQALQAVHVRVFELIMRAIRIISPTIVQGLVVGMLAAGLLRFGKKAESVFLVSVAGCAALVSWLLKLIIGRPRPGDEIFALAAGGDGASFPSGHAIYAVVVYGFLMSLALHSLKQPLARWLLVSFLITLIVLTGVSRIYIGVHWPSDVFGGFLVGWLLLAPCIALHRHYATTRNKLAARIIEYV